MPYIAGDLQRDRSARPAHADTPVSLSRRVPLLENLGFRVISEQTYDIGVRTHAGRRRGLGLGLGTKRSARTQLTSGAVLAIGDQVIDDRGIGQRRSVAERTEIVLGDLPKNPAHVSLAYHFVRRERFATSSTTESGSTTLACFTRSN